MQFAGLFLCLIKKGEDAILVLKLVILTNQKLFYWLVLVYRFILFSEFGVLSLSSMAEIFYMHHVVHCAMLVNLQPQLSVYYGLSMLAKVTHTKDRIHEHYITTKCRFFEV